MKTFLLTLPPKERKWHLINAENRVLGKIAVLAANRLRGKGNPTFTPHIDAGDHVIVINAEKVVLTGKKLQNKTYGHHTRHPGGLRIIPASKMLAEKPEKIIIHAVAGMIPRNRLKEKILSRLHVYRDATHPHTANNPISVS